MVDPALEPGLGLPRDVSSEGWRIDRLIEETHLFVIALAVIALGWLLYAVIAHRDRRGRRARYLRGETWRAAALPLSIAAFVLLVVDGNLFLSARRDLAVLADTAGAERAEGAVRVQVSAHQWAWEFRYPGPDGLFATADDVVTTNDLRVPRGRPVVLQLASSDVIHSFHLPNLRVKTDAIPGRINTVWFQAEAFGRFPIACAQFCGVNHYKMIGELTVLEPEAFASWLAGAARDARRIHEEAERAARDEPTAREDRRFPTFTERPSRDWGWPWEEGRR
jgi:cytochrome c oxidase subunit II